MTIQIKLSTPNLETTVIKLKQFEGDIMPITQEQVLDALEASRKEVVDYPPELPAQKYVRTGNYGGSWRVEAARGSRSIGGRLLGQATANGRDYTRYVGGNAQGGEQAGIHQGRWRVAWEAVQDQIGSLSANLNTQLALAAARRGL